MLKKEYIYLLLLIMVVFSCEEDTAEKRTTLFEELAPSHTQITFINALEQTEEFNTYTFRNFYNGAGVALGDINNDGLTDIYFAGNTVNNKLYLNKGDFQFEDITAQAGVACANVWSTGVSMVDLNADGWLDIYVCKSGPPGGPNRYNELFINQQDGTFKEMAKAWNLADEGLSVHAVFFDYDKDGDLDAYLLNNSLRSIGTGSDLRQSNRDIRDANGGNKLYRNEGNRFVDVSEEAGIYGSAIGFGLGVTIGDVNRDGWQDIYVSNDFFEKDYLYINQQNGTFQEDLENWMREISMGSMGADMADLNNDGYPEIFVTEMLPDSDARYKTKAQFESWETYQRKLAGGYYHQFGRNVLQLNNGDNTFSEIGRLVGVEATDWSWGALIFDMNADGQKDLFVANGIYKDLLDQDYVNFYSNAERVRDLIQTEENAVLKMIEDMPSEALSNYAFVNQSSLDASTIQFVNLADSFGLDAPAFSNGSAYGDLDNDGDLDLVVNNVNRSPFIYKNNTKEQTENHTLSIQLTGEGNNTFGLGAQVTVYADDRIFYQELAPMRGFQSSVEPRLHFGLGEIAQIDSLTVVWNSGKESYMKNLETNQLLTINENNAQPATRNAQSVTQTSKLFTQNSKLPKFQHRENPFSDFNRDRLLFHMLSTEGPKITKGDVNGDGLEDVYIGGAKDQAGGLFLQQRNGIFKSSNESLLEQDKVSEDTDALFFDADTDGDLDLYVASGGNEFPSSSSALIDRLYINDGKGNFEKSQQVLPTFQFESTACVEAADFDGDGDEDLFVGIRLRPFLYGVPVNGYVLENDGNGKFKDITKRIAPELQHLGLITDALWLDIDGDEDQDLVVAGEWMPITFFIYNNGQFTKSSNHQFSNSGFWHCLQAADLDQDGDLDFVAGNLGKNSRLKADESHPLRMYVNDFDQNQTAEQIITQYEGEKAYPLVLRNDLIMQLPSLKKKYLKFDNYQAQQIEDIFTSEQLKNALTLEVTTTETSLYINKGDGSFERKPLPIQAQFSPVYAIQIEDFDRDGHLDILLGGNFYRSKPEIGIYDASYGTFLKGDGRMNFTAVPAAISGFQVKGEIRDFDILNGNTLLIGKNNDAVESFTY